MIPDPSSRKILSRVQPHTTPNIVGIVFLKPKLKAEKEVTILLGPGEKPAAIPKSIRGIKFGYIYLSYLNYLLGYV